MSFADGGAPLAPHEFWQALHAAGTFPTAPAEGFRDSFPAVLPDGRQLPLPIRVLPGDGQSAVASLILNQASFAVKDALAATVAGLVRELRPEVAVGVPTLGLPLAEGVARQFGHTRMVALGTSRKFWREAGLSEPISSITSPAGGKTVFLDPRTLPLLAGKRAVVVDDVISSGTSMTAVLRLLDKAGIRPVAVTVAMLQTERWHDALAPFDVPVLGAFRSPSLRRTEAGSWAAIPQER